MRMDNFFERLKKTSQNAGPPDLPGNANGTINEGIRFLESSPVDSQIRQFPHESIENRKLPAVSTTRGADIPQHRTIIPHRDGNADIIVYFRELFSRISNGQEPVARFIFTQVRDQVLALKLLYALVIRSLRFSKYDRFQGFQWGPLRSAGNSHVP
jgi:hypothetical protein